MLAEQTRMDLAAVVAQLVQNSVQGDPRGPITVTVVLGAEAIHGEVTDQGNPVVVPPQDDNGSGPNGNGLDRVKRLTSRCAVQEGSNDVRFEMPRGER
jgi:anti-sigma regulatory factor (Ser/Thr protein kinase)